MKKRMPGTWFHYDHVFAQEPLKLTALELLQIGEVCLEANAEIEPHPQHCHEISYIISGSGQFLQDGACVEVSAEDLIISPASGTHAIRASDGQALSFAYVGFHFLPDRFPDAAVQARFAPPIQQLCRDHNDIYLHFRRCIDEFYLPEGGNLLIIEACLMEILVWTCRSLNAPSKKPDYQEGAYSPGSLVYHIYRHVDNYIDSPLTVAGIADALGYSPYYISHHFRQKTGGTLQQYIAARKIEKAKELIALNRLSFAQIAEKLSYSNPQAFSRSFRNETGLSPTAYLKSL